jgi:HTH-type transcriptional regulator, transcriptional repressor of NAD biosynthesis genes
MAKELPKFATGLILGKFMPIHKGHQYLIDFALQQVEHLTVIVGSLADEPIPGQLRYQWVKELYPAVNVQHCTDENPQYPHEHTDFWNIWVASIRRLMPQGPDVVFTSEEYGEELARRLGASHILCDLSRSSVPVSATSIRNNPYENWQFIPEPVRPYFVRRVVIYGPESTGKTTLAEKLASHYQTVWVPEFARNYLDDKGAWVELPDIEKIAAGQLASEDRLARQANCLLICDTDLITTCVYSRHYFGECPKEVEQMADQRQYDLYLLLDIDVPFVADWQRPDGESREQFFLTFRSELECRGRRFVVISGSYEERFGRAVKAIDELLNLEWTERL